MPSRSSRTAGRSTSLSGLSNRVSLEPRLAPADPLREPFFFLLGCCARLHGLRIHAADVDPASFLEWSGVAFADLEHEFLGEALGVVDLEVCVALARNEVAPRREAPSWMTSTTRAA